MFSICGSKTEWHELLSQVGPGGAAAVAPREARWRGGSSNRDGSICLTKRGPIPSLLIGSRENVGSGDPPRIVNPGAPQEGTAAFPYLIRQPATAPP
ncbi:hypothetical protein CB1_001533021 [Camelus ferus]|nr:hypothetical protein CB1_001533021 [Camelus ferus]